MLVAFTRWPKPMSKLRIIRTEIDIDPLTPPRGYFGMTDQQVADDGNTKYRTRPTGFTPSEKFLAAIQDANLNAALAQPDDKEYVDWLLKLPNGIPMTDPAYIARLDDIFSMEPTTLANLVALRIESISRWVELEVGEIHAGDVGGARALI